MRGQSPSAAPRNSNRLSPKAASTGNRNGANGGGFTRPPPNETFDAGHLLSAATAAVSRAFAPSSFVAAPRSARPPPEGLNTIDSMSFVAGPPEVSRPSYWEVHVTRLLDIPHLRNHMGKFWGHPDDFVVRAEDDKQRLLAKTPVIFGDEGGGSTATIDVGPDGILRFETADERILLTVERSDGHVVGHCPVNLADPRNEQPFAYTILDERGKSENCGIELQVSQRCGTNISSVPSMGSMYHRSEYGRLANTGGEAHSFFTLAAAMGFQTASPSSSSRPPEPKRCPETLGPMGADSFSFPPEEPLPPPPKRSQDYHDRNADGGAAPPPAPARPSGTSPRQSLRSQHPPPTRPSSETFDMSQVPHLNSHHRSSAAPRGGGARPMSATQQQPSTPGHGRQQPQPRKGNAPQPIMPHPQGLGSFKRSSLPGSHAPPMMNGPGYPHPAQMGSKGPPGAASRSTSPTAAGFGAATWGAPAPRGFSSGSGYGSGTGSMPLMQAMSPTGSTGSRTGGHVMGGAPAPAFAMQPFMR
mmetsp:Transcript_35751/g.83733  ORF Transcript_35751/g.83733 Transcript_35751/m.83733 type:complete len:528 (-) Transcript_35751:199-1782(-)